MKRILLFLTCVLTLFGVARAEDVTVEITYTSFGNPGGYAFYKTSEISGTAYAANFYGSNKCIQTNKSDNQNGFITTKNTNGEIKSLKFEFTSAQTTSRDFTVYFSNTPYEYTTGTTESLKPSSISGTVSKTYKATTSPVIVDVPNGYKYWAFTNPSGAIYMSTITVVYAEAANVPSGPVDYDAPFANQNYSVEVGKSVSINVGDSYPTDLSFSTSDSKYVSIKGFEITGVAEGTATISATWKDDENFNASSTTFTVNVKEASNLPSAGDEFNLISELKELEEGNFYVLAYTYNGNNYAMSPSVASSRIKAQSVTVQNNRTLILDDGVTVFQLGKDSNGDWTWCVTNEGQYEGKYLSWAKGSTNNGYENAAAGIKVEETDNNQFSLLIEDRYLLGYQGNDFRAYLEANLSNGVFPNIYKYEIPSHLQPANLSFSETEVTAYLNLAFTTPTLTNNTGEKATYKSSDESVASVNPETGEVTLKDAGITVISAETPENDIYKAGYAEYSIIVIDPNAPTTELTVDFFGNKTNSYDLVNQTDSYGFEYSSVYSAQSGNIAFNKGTTNGKSSGIVVSKINDNYIITSIDIELGNSNMSLNVYKSSSAYDRLVKETAPSSTNWEKVNNTPITTSQEIQINDYAFAILPNTSSSMQIKKIVVNYKKLPVNVSMHEGDDDWMQSGKVDNDELTISMQTLQKNVIVFILDVPDGKVPHYAITDQKPLDEVVFDPTDQDMSSAYSAKNASRRAAANEDVTAPADEDFQPAQIYEQDKHPQSGSYYAVLPTGTTGNLHIRYTNAEGENPSDYVTYGYTVTYDTPTGVETVVIGVGEGEVIYFDLNGRRVANPDKGIFIKVEADKVSKVIL